MAATMKIPGSIFKAKNARGETIYKIEVDLGTGVDGKRVRLRRTAQSLLEAERLRKDLYIQKQQATLTPAPKETLATYAAWWIQNVKRGRIRESTLGDYEYRLARYILPRFGRMRLGDITVRDVETWMRELRSGKGLSVTTVNGARTVLNLLLTHAFRSNLITQNPVVLTKPFRSQFGDRTQVQEPWSLDEIRAALDAVRGTGVDLFVTLGVACGLRRGESLGLHWDDIDFEAGTLTISQALKQGRIVAEDGTVSVRLVQDATKTKSSHRTLPLGPLVTDALLRAKAAQDQARSAAGARWVDSGFVITSSIGTPVSPSNLRRELVSVLGAAGVRHIRIHDMRHTAALQALEAGEPLEVVSQALGHSDVNTTKRIYAPHVEAYSNRFMNTLSELYRPMQDEIDELTRRPDAPERVVS